MAAGTAEFEAAEAAAAAAAEVAVVVVVVVVAAATEPLRLLSPMPRGGEEAGEEATGKMLMSIMSPLKSVIVPFRGLPFLVAASRRVCLCL